MSIFSKLLAAYRSEPAATQTAVAAIYAGWLAIDNGLIKHVSVLNWQIVLAAAIALYGLLVRSQVIPVIKVQAKVKAVPPPTDPAQ